MNKAYGTMIILSCFLIVFPPLRAASAPKKETVEATKQDYQTVQEDSIREAFYEYLQRQLGKERSEIAVSKLQIQGNRPIPAGNVSFQLFQKDKRKLTGYVRIVAVVRVNGEVKNEIQLSGWVDVFESVVCATRNIEKGEIIDKKDLYLARSNISYLSTDVIKDISKAAGLQVKHRIRKDALVKRWMLEKPAIVDRGDMVTILAENGALRVTVPGMVLEKGYEGKLVRVQNAMSRKVIYAKVVDNLTVKVDL
jgi:flagella basal body P-ring formation protein FlgA